MTDHLISPDRQVTIGKQTYTLDGSFKTLKAIQHAFGKDILLVLADSMLFRLKFDEVAQLFHIGITGSGVTPPEAEVIEKDIIEEIGINEASELAMEWLTAATSPKRERAGNVERVLKAIQAGRVIRLKAPK